MRQIRVMAVVLFAGSLCSGCMQQVHLYSGPIRSPFKLAALEVTEWAGGLDLKIDGKTVEWERSGHYPVYVYILPGKHTIKWDLEIRGTAHIHSLTEKTRVKEYRTSYRGEGILDAKEGKNYYFRYASLKGRKSQISSPLDRYRREYLIEVKDTATWIEDPVPSLFAKPEVVAGTLPEWIGWHTCEVCGEQKAAAPKEYACPKCRRKGLY